MNTRESMRKFDRVVTNKIGDYVKNTKIALMIGRVTSPVFWASYLILVHYFLVTPGMVIGDVLLAVVLLPLASLLKLFFRRKRPATLYVNNMKVKSYSFPSSHAYSSALACGYFAYLCTMNGAFLIAPFILMIAVVVGISRIVVGAHYPSDVVAGWLLGLLTLASIVVIN